MKRVFDVSVALAVLGLLSPVLIVVALAVRLDLGRPILFAQARPGKRGRPFRLSKFRTMRDAVDERGQPLPDGDRLTRLGRVLRWTSLDELPELFNVLKGDMSLVGPRPLLLEYLPLYSAHQKRRHEVRPGITGLAQIGGRNAIPWEEKFAMDVWYVDNRTFLLDLRILARTVVYIMRREGINQAGHPTVERFRGSAPKAAIR